jgi:hypothetical protein
MAVFCDYGNGLHAPDFANCEPELPKVSSHTPKYSRFSETRAREEVNDLSLRLHERIIAMRHRRRRLPLRDRLRRRRRLMALALKKGNRTLCLPEL